MSLVKLLLSDYGNIPEKIGLFLLRKNSSTLEQIKLGTELSQNEIIDGLSVLIQRRFVKFFIFEKIFKYTIDSTMITRRIYFPIYFNYISANYSSKYASLFSKVLARGTYKDNENNPIFDELLTANIVRIEQIGTKESKHYNFDDDGSKKHFKPTERFFIVNFDHLDQKIFEEETIKFISKRYNEAAASVLRSVLKCEIVDRNSIITNLDSTKILISDNGNILNEKENITEYLKYLCSSKVIYQGFDEKRNFFFNSSVTPLKTYKILILLKDPAMKRIFKMISEKNEIEDKNITIHSLLGVNKVKMALLGLQKLGLISQKCLGEYSGGSKMDHCWYIDINTASLSMLKRLDEQIISKIKNINSCWDGNYFMENESGNTDVWASDLISLATDHLILQMGVL